MGGTAAGSGPDVNERRSRGERPDREDAAPRIDDPVVSQAESEDVAGVAAEEQVPGRTGDAMGGAMPRPRARSAREAAGAVGAEHITKAKHDIAPGGTIETGLTPSGTASMVASQLLWDGAAATSRIDMAIAEATAESEDRAGGGSAAGEGSG